MMKKQKISDSQQIPEQVWKKTKWYCRYCRQQNFVNGSLNYVPNNYKCVLRKNINRNLLPPLILFVIDQSGSMGQTISVQTELNSTKGVQTSSQQNKLIKISKQINQMIKRSYFYEKTKHKQRQQLQKIGLYDEKVQYEKKNENENQNYFSKIAFFMAIIEDYLPKIKQELQNQQFRVGFIFFNQSIFLLKPSYQKMVPTYSPKQFKQTKRKFPFDQKFIDFDSFDALYKQGRKYDRFFGDSSFKKLDLSKVVFQNLEISGQTSLGPALVFALGILSVHDIGSRLIVISDSNPNYGLLASQNLEENQNNYNRIGQIIKQKQISLGILRWIEQDMKNYYNEKKINDSIIMQFDKFVKEERTLIQQITLDFSMGFNQFQVLDRARKSLIGLLKRGSIGRALKIDIKCDNPSVKIERFKYDHIDFRFMKYLGTRNKNWIQMYAFKVKQSQTLFPVYTQIVIRYQDVFTKQQCLFMSYCSHKILKIVPKTLLTLIKNPKQYKKLMLSEAEYEELGNECFRQDHLNQLQNLEYIQTFEYENVIPEALSSKMHLLTQQGITFQQNKNSLNKLAQNLTNININQSDQQVL